MPSGCLGTPQHLPKGTAGSPAQPLRAHQSGAASCRGEGREALQLAEKYAYERQTRQAAEKAPLAACAPSRCLPPGTAQLLTPGAEGSPLRFPAPARRLPSACRAGPRAHGFKEAGSWHRHCWLGAQAGLGPAPSPLLSLLLPPWLWVLSILNRFGFQRLFNSFLGSAFSLSMLLVWLFSPPFHFQPAKCRQHSLCPVQRVDSSRAASQPWHLRMGKVRCIGARDRLPSRQDATGLCPQSSVVVPFPMHQSFTWPCFLPSCA